MYKCVHLGPINLLTKGAKVFIVHVGLLLTTCASMCACQFSTIPPVLHPDPRDPCYQDHVLCAHPTLPKLTVYFNNRRIYCNEIVSREDTLRAPTVHFAHSKWDQHFLLIMIDPDAPYPCAPPDVTMEHVLHYVTIVTWVNGVLIPTRDTLNYHPPAPPRGIHRYQVFVYTWTNSRIPDLDYNSPNNRAGFNRTIFQAANHLGEPVAVFQFRSEHQVFPYVYVVLVVVVYVLFDVVVGFIANVVF